MSDGEKDHQGILHHVVRWWWNYCVLKDPPTARLNRWLKGSSHPRMRQYHSTIHQGANIGHTGVFRSEYVLSIFFLSSFLSFSHSFFLLLSYQLSLFQTNPPKKEDCGFSESNNNARRDTLGILSSRNEIISPPWSPWQGLCLRPKWYVVNKNFGSRDNNPLVEEIFYVICQIRCLYRFFNEIS